MTGRTGVLVLSHGTPSSLDEVEAFYTRIRRGRPPSTEQLDELVGRYAAIGSVSPLTARTDDQVRGLRAALEDRAPERFVVAGATKYMAPSIEAACAELLDDGVADVVGIVLSPLDATMTTDQYHDRATAAINGRVDYHAVRSWWDAPGFVPLVAARVEAARAAPRSVDELVVFSAHSLPVRADPDGTYAKELSGAAAAVAASAGLRNHLVCWQSAGRTDDTWLGPDLLEVLRGLDPAATPHVVVCPIGFVSDHLEVLFDIDIEAREVARASGLALTRTLSFNDDAEFLSVLCDVVLRAVGA